MGDLLACIPCLKQGEMCRFIQRVKNSLHLGARVPKEKDELFSYIVLHKKPRAKSKRINRGGQKGNAKSMAEEKGAKALEDRIEAKMMEPVGSWSDAVGGLDRPQGFSRIISTPLKRSVSSFFPARGALRR